jgi:histone H3/H4
MEFGIYLQRVLKQLHVDTGCTAKGLAQLNQLSNDIGMKLSEVSVDLSKNVGHITVTSREIQTAVSLLLPVELKKLCVKVGSESVSKYLSSMAGSKESKESSESNDRQRRELRAGLHFPVARCAKLIKNVDKSMSIGQTAPVYLASVLELLMSEILEHSGNVCKDYHRKCITPRHIFLAINGDEELSNLLNKLDIHLIEVGVIPHIHKELVVNKTKKKSTKKTADTTNTSSVSVGVNRKAHRFRPGTVALREIRRYQKTTEPLTQFAPFERFVRTIANNYSINIQFAQKSLEYLHEIVENRIVKLFKNSQVLALHAGRTSVNVKDIKIAQQFNDNEQLHSESNYDEKFMVDNAIVRLARRGGVKRLDHLVYNEIRNYANKLTTTILYAAAALVNHRRAVNITIKDFQKSTDILGLGTYVHAQTN